MIDELPPPPTPAKSPHLGLQILMACAALLPVAYVASWAVAASRNIVFWDEFDTALNLIIRLHAGADWREILDRLFEVSNEHRMLTSRLLFAASYWISGTVNFHVIGAIGNLFIVGACGLLVDAAATTPRRLRLGLILAFLVFQLENFESFLWSGASIDHFQVILLAVAALAAVARGTQTALIAACLLAVLATFTLTHGCMVWVVGAALLAYEGRRSHLALWCGIGAVVLGAFFSGFHVNPGHRFGDLTFAGVGQMGVYWLSLLGGPLALGDVRIAPVLGLILLTALGALGAHGAARREPLFFSVAVFAILSCGLVALGRSEVSGGQILSRYMILGLLAWSLVIFLAAERFATAERPYRHLLWYVPLLALFNVSANTRYAAEADFFAEARDRAVTRFIQFGADGHGLVPLNPIANRASTLLQIAAQEGVYQLPNPCQPRTFPVMQPNARILPTVDQKVVSPASISLDGWAVMRDHTSRRGQIHVLLRSKNHEFTYTTISIKRPDVATAHHESRWAYSGYRLVVPRDQLPAEDFQVGILIAEGNQADFVMTDHWLNLSPTQAAQD